jgi:hypothetical protein
LNFGMRCRIVHCSISCVRPCCRGTRDDGSYAAIGLRTSAFNAAAALQRGLRNTAFHAVGLRKTRRNFVLSVHLSISSVSPCSAMQINPKMPHSWGPTMAARLPSDFVKHEILCREKKN